MPKSMQNVFFFKIISNAAVWYFGPLNFPIYLDCHCTIRYVSGITFIRYVSVITFIRYVSVTTFIRYFSVITFIRYAHSQKTGKPNNSKHPWEQVSQMARTGQPKSTMPTLVLINHVSAESLTTEIIIPSGTNSINH